MGDKNTKKINLHHSQRDNRIVKQAEKAEHRRITFEITRATWKASIEADRQKLIFAVAVFLVGLACIAFGLAYVVGAILYG